MEEFITDTIFLVQDQNTFCVGDKLWNAFESWRIQYKLGMDEYMLKIYLNTPTKFYKYLDNRGLISINRPMRKFLGVVLRSDLLINKSSN